jgi:pimeloyl-ACP methyl ester carboxylesterase
MVEEVSGEPLITSRLRLEPIAEAHTALLLELASTPDVMRFIGDGSLWSRERVEDVASWQRDHWRQHGFGWRAAFDRVTGAAVGFSMLNFAGEGSGVDAGEYEIGWWLHPRSWGAGLAREGATVVRDEAFARLRAPSVVARIQPENAASIAVATSIGLSRDHQSRGRTGEPIDVMRLTAERWRYDERVRRNAPITIAGRRIDAIELEGDAGLAPVVMLHEGLGSVGLWRDFPAQVSLATGRRVVAFSRFGHGRSEPSPWPPDVTGFHHREALELLPELLSALDIDRPLLLGHSDGASIALIHAGRHPVSGLALLAPHVFVEPLTLASIRETRDDYLVADLRGRMERHHDNVDAAFWGWCDMWLHRDFRFWNLEADVALVTAPTLLIQGADDPYGTLEQLDRIEASIRGPVARLVVPGGHSPHLDATDEVVTAVANFASATL